MEKPFNGFEYLEKVRQQKGGNQASGSDLAEYLNYKAREKGVPLIGKFELTPLCNFDCKMCYVHLMKDQLGTAEIMTVEQWKDLMYQAWQAGMIYCSLTGGECLAYPGFEEIYLYLQDLGCEVNVLTNGYLLDERWIEFFRKHRPLTVQITLYGSNDDVYERVTGKRAFSTVMNNIRRLVETGIQVIVSLTPNSYLGEDVLETLRVAYDITNEVVINPMLSPPRKETGRTGIGDEADIDVYVRLYRLKAELDGQQTGEPYEGILPEVGGSCHECMDHGIRCGAGRSSFSIDWKGIMTLCGSLDYVQCHPMEEGFASAWKKLNQAARNWPRVPECEGCAYQSVCITCAAYETQFAEPGKQPKALCERAKYFVRHGIGSIPVCE